MGKSVNIIFAAATLPALAAALEAISNGNETYVYLARGKTYCGIDKIKQFHNMGYDEEKSQPIDDEKAFTAAVRTVKELLEKDNSLFFNFYAREFDAFRCAGIASAAGIPRERFHIYMMEDGLSTYKNFDMFWCEESFKWLFRDVFYSVTRRVWFSEKAAEIPYKILKFIFSKSKTLKKLSYKRIYKYFKKHIKICEARFNKIISKNQILYNDKLVSRSVKEPFPLCFNSNFTLVLQNEGKIHALVAKNGNKYIENLLEAKEEITPKIIFKPIYERIAALNSEQRDMYMSLVLPDEAKQIFFRSKRAGKAAPAKKLVYISARTDRMFINPVTGKAYGIGAVDPYDFPASYQQMSEKYKSCFLFGSENDFNIIADTLNSFFNECSASEEIINETKRKVLNIYMDYIFILKFIFYIYGKEYDIIVKNHPATDFGCTGGEDLFRTKQNINITQCLNAVFSEFFSRDSIGKYLAIVPGSISCENFEYIGADIAFGGQPSSAYSGLSADAKIMFLLYNSDTNISSYFNGDPHFSLTSNDDNACLCSDGQKYNTVFYNTEKFIEECKKIDLCCVKNIRVD